MCVCELNIALAVGVHNPSSLLGSIVLGQQPARGLEKVFPISARPMPGGMEPGPSWRNCKGVLLGMSHWSSCNPGASAGLAWRGSYCMVSQREQGLASVLSILFEPWGN